MDLHDFDSAALYFDEPCPPVVAALLAEAAEGYAAGAGEAPLLRAYFLAPEQLAVLVGLYRFYFYQHRHADADIVAVRAMNVSGARLELPTDWSDVGERALAGAASRSIGLLRFWMLALKARALLALRDGRLEAGRRMLARLVELDQRDRLGVKALYDISMQSQSEAGEAYAGVFPACSTETPGRREHHVR